MSVYAHNTSSCYNKKTTSEHNIISLHFLIIGVATCCKHLQKNSECRELLRHLHRVT
jgi:hypothetical protein